MKLPHLSIALILIVLAAYVIGARYPTLAQMIKVA